MSDTPLVDECVAKNATGIFDLARDLERRIKYNETAKDLLINALYNALHDTNPHFVDLYSKHAPKERVPLYDILHKMNRNAMESYSQYRDA